MSPFLVEYILDYFCLLILFCTLLAAIITRTICFLPTRNYASRILFVSFIVRNEYGWLALNKKKHPTKTMSCRPCYWQTVRHYKIAIIRKKRCKKKREKEVGFVSIKLKIPKELCRYQKSVSPKHADFAKLKLFLLNRKISVVLANKRAKKRKNRGKAVDIICKQRVSLEKNFDSG